MRNAAKYATNCGTFQIDFSAIVKEVTFLILRQAKVSRSNLTREQRLALKEFR